jgi:hypothetical protein
MSGTTSQTGSGINKQTAEAIRPAPRMSDTAPSTGPIHRHRIRCWLLPFSIVDAAGAARRRAMPRAAGRPTSCRYRTTLARSGHVVRKKAREMRQTAQERTDRGDSDRPNVTSEGDLVARIFPAGAFPKLSRQAART